MKSFEELWNHYNKNSKRYIVYNPVIRLSTGEDRELESTDWMVCHLDIMQYNAEVIREVKRNRLDNVLDVYYIIEGTWDEI